MTHSCPTRRSSDLSISRQERPTCAEHQSQRLPSRPQPPSERIVQSLVTTLVSFGQSLAKIRLPLAIGVRLSRMLLSSRGLPQLIVPAILTIMDSFCHFVLPSRMNKSLRVWAPV